MTYALQSLIIWALVIVDTVIASMIRHARALQALVQSRSVAIELDRAERIRVLGQSLYSSSRLPRRTRSGVASSSSTETTGKRTGRRRGGARSSEGLSATSSTDVLATEKVPSSTSSATLPARPSEFAFDRACTAENPCALHSEWLGAGQQP